MKFHILAYQHHLMKLDNSEGKITCAELTANIKRMKNEKKSWINTSEFHNKSLLPVKFDSDQLLHFQIH
jgi:hypothetical protein